MAALRLVPVAVAVAVLAALAPPASAAGRVLVVGDSLEVGTGPHLREELSGRPVQVDARIGRPSGEGVGVLRSRIRSSDEVVVFDLGVNDDPSQPGRLAGDLQAARSLAGNRCLVVATVSGPPVNGVPVSGLNRVIRRFAAETPTAQLVDWHAAVAENAGILNRDRLHPGPNGYALRARLVAEGVEACGGSKATPSRPRRTPGPNSREPEATLEVPWSNAALLTPYGAVAAYVSGVAGLVMTAGEEVRAVIVPGRSEPVLGAP
jgi:lysophospholipase L1-like esterase